MPALHITHRPQELSDVAGQKGAIATIESIMNREIANIPQAWLLQGPPGTGKTTLSRIIIDLLGIEPFNFSEYNAANTRGVDTIRNVARNAAMMPMGGGRQAFLFDEAHMLTKEAQNALLKILEDTPLNTFFFLATTNPESLRKAVISRCTIVTVNTIDTRTMTGLINKVLKAEGVNDFPSEVTAAIVKNSNGACRDAIKLLDTVIDMIDTAEMIEAINEGYADSTSVKDLWTVLLNKSNAKLKWKSCSKILKTINGDPESTRRALLSVFSNNLLQHGSPVAAEMIECFENNYYDSGKAGLILSCFNACHIE